MKSSRCSAYWSRTLAASRKSYVRALGTAMVTVSVQRHTLKAGR